MIRTDHLIKCQFVNHHSRYRQELCARCEGIIHTRGQGAAALVLIIMSLATTHTVKLSLFWISIDFIRVQEFF